MEIFKKRTFCHALILGNFILLNLIKNEIAKMKVVDHPNIVKLFEFFEDDENMYIIKDY